jgi:cell division protein FtsL
VNYKFRNTIVLGILLLLVCILSAAALLWYYPTKIGDVEKNIVKLKKQIAALDGIDEEYYDLENTIKEQEQKLSKLDKRIASSVSPASTYHYLNSILHYSGLLDFNLLYLGNKSLKGYNYNIYSVKGEGSYATIFRFISYIERGPEFYKINSLEMRVVESKDEETGRTQIVIPFDMELWALYADVKDLPRIKRTLGNVSVYRVRNPFYPYIYRNIPANVDGLLEVERAELKAVMPDKAMIADKNGKIHVLREGDRVYMGYLSKIDVERNEIEFILNKGGIVDNFKLRLRFSESK